jgi:hypothetical protein
MCAKRRFRFEYDHFAACQGELARDSESDDTRADHCTVYFFGHFVDVCCKDGIE